MTLPDCPHCSSTDSLTAVRAETKGVRVCECSCCTKQCRVNESGKIVHQSGSVSATMRDEYGIWGVLDDKD